MKKLWLWPVIKFWKFKPHQLVIAIVWNICELCGKPIPFQDRAFGIIIGRKGVKK